MDEWDDFLHQIRVCITPGLLATGPNCASVLMQALAGVIAAAPAEHRMTIVEEYANQLTALVRESLD